MCDYECTVTGITFVSGDIVLLPEVVVNCDGGGEEKGVFAIHRPLFLGYKTFIHAGL